MILIFLLLTVYTELNFRPRIDKTIKNEWLLWYNTKGKRTYIKVWKS